MGRLEVKIYSAANLVPDSPYGCFDPECSVTVERCTSTLSAPRAPAPKRKAVNPVWNQSLLFNVNERELGNCQVHVTFFDTDDNGTKHQIGSCSIPVDGLNQGIEKVHVQNLQNTVTGASVTVGLTALDFSSSYSSSYSSGYTGTTPQYGQNYSQNTTPYNQQPSYQQPSQQQPAQPSYSQQPASGYNSPGSAYTSAAPNTGSTINRSSPTVSSPADFVYGGSQPSQTASQGASGSTPNDFVYGQYGGASQTAQSSDKTVFGVYGGNTPTPSPVASRTSSYGSAPTPSPAPSNNISSSYGAPPSPSPIHHPLTGSGSNYSGYQSSLANEPYKPEQSRPLTEPYKVNEPYKPEPARPVAESYKANEPMRPSAPTPTPSPLSNSGRGFPVPAGGGLKKAVTVGPFALKKRAPVVAPRSLKEYQGSEIHRDFPHIARGSFGIVFKGKVDGFAETVVIKDMDIRDQKSVEDWKKEIHVMSQNLSNPYCAQVYGYSSTGNTLTIIMEFFPKGDLFKVLHTEPDKHPLSLLARMRMARHVVLGISFLHENSFLHRDIKSMNLLVTNDYECKLTDFGTAKLSSDRTSFNTVNTGTPLWMAPEVKQGFYNFSADVYSMGLVLYEIFERRVPVFDQQRQQVNLPAQFMSAPVVLPCIDRNPESRPKPRQVLSVIDNLIKTTVLEVKKLLPQATLEHIKYGDYGTDPTDGPAYDGCDALDSDLLAIYRYLLTMPPKEVDDLIEQAFHFQMSAPPSAADAVDPSNPHTGQRPPQAQAQPQQPPLQQQHSAYPPMGSAPTPYPSQHGLSPLPGYPPMGQPGYPPMGQPGYHPPSAVPPTAVPIGYPSLQPGYPIGLGYQTPPPGFGYPPGY